MRKKASKGVNGQSGVLSTYVQCQNSSTHTHIHMLSAHLRCRHTSVGISLQSAAAACDAPPSTDVSKYIPASTPNFVIPLVSSFLHPLTCQWHASLPGLHPAEAPGFLCVSALHYPTLYRRLVHSELNVPSSTWSQGRLLADAESVWLSVAFT